MPIESRPKCVDGPRQQLTTGTKMRECLLRATPGVLMAHAKNSQKEGKRGTA